jgi:hypothetical protein
VSRAGAEIGAAVDSTVALAFAPLDPLWFAVAFVLSPAADIV